LVAFLPQVFQVRDEAKLIVKEDAEEFDLLDNSYGSGVESYDGIRMDSPAATKVDSNRFAVRHGEAIFVTPGLDSITC